MTAKPLTNWWRDLTTAGKALWAACASLGTLATAWVVISGFLSLPSRVDALETHQAVQDAAIRRNTAFGDVLGSQMELQSCTTLADAGKNGKTPEQCADEYQRRERARARGLSDSEPGDAP